jgi:hypothetical protein
MQVNPLGRWTVLIYTSASRDLEGAVRDSLQEICLDPGVPPDVQVVAQMGWRGQAQRFQLHQSEQPQPLGPPQALEMTEPEQLRRFLEWGMQAYPAQHYAVILGGHGAGFAGAVTDSERRRMLKLPEIESALGQLPTRPQLVVFNTCLMAQAEVAEQLAPVASHLVASQSQLTGLGLPLAQWLQHLPDCAEGASAAQALVKESAQAGARSPHVGSVDLLQWPQLSARLDLLAEQILEHPEVHFRLMQHIQQQGHIWPRPQDRPLVDQLDLPTLCSRWASDESLPDELREQARVVVDQLARISPQGLSIYAPDQPFAQLGPPGGRVGELYQDLRWARNSRWDEAITALTLEKL